MGWFGYLVTSMLELYVALSWTRRLMEDTSLQPAKALILLGAAASYHRLDCCTCQLCNLCLASVEHGQ